MVKGGKELRKFIINQMDELKLQKRFISMLKDYNYNNENNCDVIHSILYNLSELFVENPSEIYDEIKRMNSLIDEANLQPEFKKNEKDFLIDIVKNIKIKIRDIKENKNDEYKKNDNIETKKIGNKDSMRIKLLK